MKEGDGHKTAKKRTRIWSAEAERMVLKGVLVMNKGPLMVWNERSVALGQPKQSGGERKMAREIARERKSGATAQGY